jgi:quercetin dioxygenase-like cupin family protein
VTTVKGFVRPAGSGDTYDWHGAIVTIKAGGVETLGQLAVIDSLYPAGLSVPGHRHDGEDEMFYLLDGAVELFCEDDRWTAGPGDFVFVPRGCLHGFAVAGAEPARALVIVGPPRLDQQIAGSGVRVSPVDSPQEPLDSPQGTG